MWPIKINTNRRSNKTTQSKNSQINGSIHQSCNITKSEKREKKEKKRDKKEKREGRERKREKRKEREKKRKKREGEGEKREEKREKIQRILGGRSMEAFNIFACNICRLESPIFSR